MPDETQPQLSDATIGVITALPKEYAAAVEVLGCHHEVTASRTGAGWTFALGRVPAKNGGEHVVALAMLVDMGTNMAAIVATNLMNACPNINNIIMCGIAGAIPNTDKAEDHVRLGDIVVSDRSGSIQYDLDKEDSADNPKIRNAPRPPSAALLEAVRRLQAEEHRGVRRWEAFVDQCLEAHRDWRRPGPRQDVLRDSEETPPVEHPADSRRRRGKPRVLYGPIASANKLLKNPAKRDMLRDKFGAKAVEMEAAGLADATWHAEKGYLVVRGTCDYCNAGKNDCWQSYAAVIAAAYTRAVIETLPAKQARSCDRVVVPDPHEHRTLLYCGGSFAGSNAVFSQATSDALEARGLMAAVASAASPIFGAATGNVTFRLAESRSQGVQLSVQWSGGIDDNPPTSAPTIAGMPEHVSLVARNFLDSIQKHRSEFEFEKAIAVAQDLEEWVGRHRASAEIMCEVYVTLGEVERLRLAVVQAKGVQTDDSKIRHFVDKAQEVGVPDPTGSIGKRLRGLMAFLTLRSAGAEAALAELGEGADPESIRGRLSILLDAEMFSQAADLIRGRPLHERWCEFAVTALVRSDRHVLARDVLKWTEQPADTSVRRRCLLRYAESRYVVAFRNRLPDTPLFPGDVTSEERDAIEDLLSALEPILLVAKGHRQVESELESVALQLAIRSHACLCDLSAATDLAEILSNRKPVPLELAELTLHGWVSLPGDFPQRLREDHPGDVEASILASLIEADVHGKEREGFGALIALKDAAVSQDEKLLLCKALFQLAQHGDTQSIAIAQEVTRKLLGPDHEIVLLEDVELCLRQGSHKRAHELLEASRNEESLAWLQMFARLQEAVGDHDSALEYLQKASRLVPHPQVLETLAYVGFQHGRYRIAAGALERKLRSQPDDHVCRRNLAVTHARLHQYVEAAEQFRLLREHGAATVLDRLDYATCLVHSARPQEALAVYEELSSLDDPPLAAVVSRSRVLKAMNRPAEAFTFLHSIRADYWDEPDFLAAYLDIAHAANEDKNAHQAFVRLHELQQEGRTEREYLHPGTLQELKEHLEDFQERRDFGYQQILLARLPWLFVDGAIGYVPYLAWLLRTQEMPWLVEEPLEQARFAIYATNGYSVGRRGKKQARLMPIECPAKGTSIVADLSALFTLHRLQILEGAADYFGEIVVPLEYMSHTVSDAECLVPHQLSQKTAFDEIRRALDSRLLVSVEERDTADLPFVDEHGTDDEAVHRYRLIDIVQVLHDSGQIHDSKRAELLEIVHRPSGRDDDHPPLQPGTVIRVALPTLRTLTNFGVLRSLLEAFQVRITPPDHAEVNGSLRWFRAQEDVLQWHRGLWDFIRDSPRFKKVPCAVPEEPEVARDVERLPKDISLLAVQYAIRNNVPLLADDRMCQMLVLNQQNSTLSAAFGSDKVLLALHDAGLITTDRVADGMLALMNWRYRFIVLPADFLKMLADRFIGHPPGKDLRDVARYAHACLRDAGLFAGPEPTVPPLPLAVRVQQDWAMVISRFIVSVWSDTQNWPEDKAEALTRWAALEFLPSSPAVLGAAGTRLAPFIGDTVFTQAAIHSVQIANVHRANRALRTIADALNLTEDEYRKLVAEVINAI